MNWTDEGLILGGRRFGEGGLILDVLTKTKGRRSGLVYGGASRARRAQYEAGNTVSLSWTGRLEEQLGRFDVAESTRERASRVLDDAGALSAISAVTTLLRGALDEGDAAGSALYEATTILLDQIEAREVWPALYVRWELGLLSALGFGLDLEECALSGANDGLTHVSPKTGRAVRGSEAEEYVNRLLRLPGFLVTPGAPLGVDDIADGLALT
ncbi:MAG: DNA repair protein RecO, partial [Alphaproteobacteria bacterium]|nr:DNA repair protein RecO [Alphaproteobacteria bacterium]